MKRKLLDILACPIDKHYPLDLIELKSKNDEVAEGVLLCSKCNRFYPIIDEIPIMLPDDLRKQDEDLEFLSKWVEKLPEEVVYNGRPVHLERRRCKRFMETVWWHASVEERWNRSEYIWVL